MSYKANPTTNPVVTTGASMRAAYSLPQAAGIMCVGITGGIGSGKSYVCARLEAAGYPVFYCDDEAKRIIRTDSEVRQELRKIVGADVYDAEGRLVKSVLAAYLCRGREYAARVDAVVHPRVARAFKERAEAMAADVNSKGAESVSVSLSAMNGPVTLDILRQMPPARTLFMECALLFESGFNFLVHYTVLVHVSAETQIARLMSRDRISRAKAMEWISLQLTEDEKMALADAYIINE